MQDRARRNLPGSLCFVHQETQARDLPDQMGTRENQRCGRFAASALSSSERFLLLNKKENQMRELMQRAAFEIRDLRRRNEFLEAQMLVVDVFAAALGLKRRDSSSMTIDIVWEIERELEKEPQRAHEGDLNRGDD